MERRSSTAQQFIVLILAVSMNLSLANGAPQAGTPSPSTPEQLDKLLAPIALYPDALLMQIVAASVDSQEVLDGGNWLLQNESLKGDQLDNAATSAGFGPAMMALFHFPQVVDMMCSEIDWTRQLGAAFSANQSAVLDSVQRLRMQAKQAGNLQTTSQQTVVTQQANGQQVIVIQPANPQVIYVPQYNPVQVYVAPAPQISAAVGVLVAFGVGVAVGAMFSSNNYYYPRWGYGGGVYYRGGPWVARTYVYRPIYGPNYRRATTYYRPPTYRYAYNKPYPGNPHYNSSNYYNNYRGNTNNQNRSNNTINRNVSGNNVTINTGNQVNNQGNKTRNTSVNSGNTSSNQSYRGQSTYNGANRNNGNSSSNAPRNPSTINSGNNSSNRANTQSTQPNRGSGNNSSTRPNTQSAQPNRGSTSTPTQRTNSNQAGQGQKAGAPGATPRTGKPQRAPNQNGAGGAQGNNGKQ